MKRKNLLLPFICMFFASLFTACSDDDKDSIKFDVKKTTLNTQGEEQFITITASSDWQVVDVPEWLSVHPTSGIAGSTEIILYSTLNKSAEPRSASITFISRTIREFTVEQLGINALDPFITAEGPSYAASVLGGDPKIEITSNTFWKITSLPDWITTKQMAGYQSAEITLSLDENPLPGGREGEILFTGEGAEYALKIRQQGRRDMIWSPALSIFSYRSLSFGASSFSAQTELPFITTGIQEKIYLGNLISHKSGSNTDMHEFTGYTSLPITASPGVYSEELEKTYIPSKAGELEIANNVIARFDGKGSSISQSKYPEFYSYRDLYIIGMLNLGLELDEILTGSSYIDNEMDVNKYGVIYSFCQNAFTIYMDTPGKLIEESLSASDRAKGASYVNSVTYGKVGLLIVESTIDIKLVKNAIDAALSSRTLTQEEIQILDSSDISYLYFIDHEAQVQRGGLDVVLTYKEEMNNKTGNLYPVSFCLADFETKAINSVSFSFKLQDAW